MQGKFIVKKTVYIFETISMIAGAFTAVLFFAFVKEAETIDDKIACAFFVGFGIFVFIISLAGIIMLKIQCLYVDDKHIYARQFFSKIDCDLDKIQQVTVINGHQLNIYTVNGKRIYLILLENAYQIKHYINIRIPKSTKDEVDLDKSVDLIRKAFAERKKNSIILWSCFGLWIVVTFGGILINSSKELSEFNRFNWAVAIVSIIISLVLLVIVLKLSNKKGKQNDGIMIQTEEIRQELILNSPMPEGKVIRAFTDTDYSARLIIMGFPNDDGLFYVVEEPYLKDNELILVRTYDSKIFNSIEEFDISFDELIELKI